MTDRIRTIFFVLNGLHNGEEGVLATTIGGDTMGHGEQMADGWYWIEDGMDDAEGPFKSKDAAKREAGKTYYSFSENGDLGEQLAYAETDGVDTFAVVIEKEANHFIIEICQYYFPQGVLKLEITQPRHRALATFSALLKADYKIESGPDKVETGT